MASMASSASPVTIDARSGISTPATSPPPEQDEDKGISRAMREEEEKMAQKRQKEESKRDERMAKERQKDVDGGKDVVDQKFKALEYLLSQSKVGDNKSVPSFH